MITESLRHVLHNYGHADTAITELTGLLKSGQMSAWAGSFHDEFAAVILDGSLTPGVVDELMQRDFDDQAAVDHWLHRAWAIWFPRRGIPALTSAGWPCRSGGRHPGCADHRYGWCAYPAGWRNL